MQTECSTLDNFLYEFLA
uniref:Uncharacterized protein n=1 Tax=Arundo donax TaxID=35708 RepID=A0A0A9F2B2_ARUDO